jgi:hypothetical protein
MHPPEIPPTIQITPKSVIPTAKALGISSFDPF